MDCHRAVLHGGVNDTLAEVRENFWIVEGRQYVKKIIKDFTKCRRFEGQKYALSPVWDLPNFRTEVAPAFLNVGLDFAGPLFVKGHGRKSSSNAYILLFSCCVSRAIHLEVVPDLTVESFLHGLHRFMSRRGIPKLLLSDNAKAFKTVSILVKKILEIAKTAKVCEFFLDHSMSWRFILAKSPWWEGVYKWF